MSEFLEKSDEEIILQIISGNKELFGIIIDRYETKLKRYGKKYINNVEELTDLVQDVFIKSYRNLKSFDTNKKFNSWIYRIAHNEFVNKLSWKYIRNYISIDTDDIIPFTLVADENVEREIIKEDEKKEMEKVLDKIDNKYRTPLILFYYEELSYDEISDILKIPKSTVGIRIKRGKEKIKKLYTN